MTAEEKSGVVRTPSSIVSRFADRTSVVGPTYIATSRHAVSKAIWTLLFLGAIGMTIYMVTINFTRFFIERPIKTTVSIGYTELPFPTVTICNTNAVRLSRLALAGEEVTQFINSLNPEVFARNATDEGGAGESSQTATSTTSHPVRRKRRYLSGDQKQVTGNTSYVPTDEFSFEDEPGETTAAQYEVERSFKYLYSQLSRQDTEKMGHQINNMLLYCSFDGRECGEKNFKLIQNAEYGNCYMFNDGGHINNASSNTFQSRRTGQSYGLQLIVNLEIEEYIKGLTLGYGMRVTLSPIQSLPPIQSEGMFVSAGMETNVGLHLVNVSRLSDPYGNCATDTYSSFLTQKGVRYTQPACQETCTAESVYLTCGCVLRSLEEMYPSKLFRDSRQCNGTDTKCVNVVKKQELTLEGCDCPTACKESVYQPLINSREWPEASYMNTLTDAVCRKSDTNTCNTLLLSPDSKQRRNFLKLNVFYRDLNYETIAEEPDYPESSFYSDLGGAIGLWVGFSVLGLLEVLQLFLEFFYGCVRKCLKGSEISASNDSLDDSGRQLPLYAVSEKKK